MTNREFFTAIINSTLADELKNFAQAEIDKLDARNDKRKNTMTKEQKENETFKVAILELLAEKPMVASEIASAMGFSTQKASALCKLLANEGKVTVGEVKVKNKGAVKQYTLVTSDTVEEA